MMTLSSVLGGQMLGPEGFQPSVGMQQGVGPTFFFPNQPTTAGPTFQNQPPPRQPTPPLQQSQGSFTSSVPPPMAAQFVTPTNFPVFQPPRVFNQQVILISCSVSILPSCHVPYVLTFTSGHLYFYPTIYYCLTMPVLQSYIYQSTEALFTNFPIIRWYGLISEVCIFSILIMLSNSCLRRNIVSVLPLLRLLSGGFLFSSRCFKNL